MAEPRSYYSDTANRALTLPALRGTRRVDVCVVGGGFTGINAAIELAQRGYRVAVLEARQIGWGASGRNGGQLITGLGGEHKIAARYGEATGALAWQMGMECVEIVRERVRDFGIDCDLHWGHFSAALKPRHLRALAEWREVLLRHGYPHALHMVPRDALPGVVGSTRYIGGLYSTGSGHLHPLNLCLGEAAAAQTLGVELFEHSPARRIVPGPRPRVETDQGAIAADHLLLACNAHLARLYPPLAGRVLPAGSYIIATEPLAEAQAHALLPTNAAVADENLVLDYFRFSADRRLLFGGLCRYSGREPRDIAAALRPNLLRVFPQLRNTRIDYQWGGHIGISLKRIPQIGRLPGNVWYAMGYSGHGLGTSHMAGRVIAEAMAGTSERFDVLARIRHWPLPGGPWLANPALALGMLYYRIKDLL